MWVNEGAFFYDPYLSDKETGKDYKYNAVPVDIQRQFANELLERENMSPDEARMLVEFVKTKEK